MACPSLVSRIEYCLENLEMRRALKRILEFSVHERKIEAVELMVQLQERTLKLDAWVQWVKVAYEKELLASGQKPSQKRSAQMTNSQNNFTRSQIKSFISQSLSEASSHPAEHKKHMQGSQRQSVMSKLRAPANAANPKQPSPLVNIAIEDEMDDIGNEDVDFVGRESSKGGQAIHKKVPSKGAKTFGHGYNLQTGAEGTLPAAMAYQRYQESQEDNDEVNLNNDSDFDELNVLDESQNRQSIPSKTLDESPNITIPASMHSSQSMHMGHVIVNNHNFVQNINMFPDQDPRSQACQSQVYYKVNVKGQPRHAM